MVTTIIPTTTGGFLHLTKLMPLLSQEPTEIIIIDNASHDNTTNYLSNYDCLIKVNKERMNFSQSNNYGVMKASGQRILFLNNDTSITPGLIREMESTFLLDPKIAVVGCLIETMENPSKIHHIEVNFTSDYIPYEVGLKTEWSPGITKSDLRVRSIREVPSVTAACMMVSKDVFNKVGGFDEEFNNGWEDTDLVLRIKEAGYKVYYNGKASIKHLKFGSKNMGRFNSENDNRQRYEELWVKTGKVQKLI